MFELSRNYKGRYICCGCGCLTGAFTRKCLNLKCQYYGGSLKPAERG